MADITDTYLQVLMDLDKAGYTMDVDGGSIIFRNKKTGMTYVDVNNGVGPKAEELIFNADLTFISEQVKNLVKVPLNEYQFTALTSFAHHIGIENFSNSGVLESLNNGRYEDVVSKMQRWRTGTKGPNTRPTVREDYVQRRQFEAELFSTPGWLDIQEELDQYINMHQGTTLSFKQQREILIGIKDRAYRKAGIFRTGSQPVLPDQKDSID